MDTNIATATIDLTEFYAKEQPGQNTYGNKTVHKVVGRDAFDDIYRVLHINEGMFCVFVESRRDSFSSFARHQGAPITLRTGTDVYVYVEEKGVRNHHSYSPDPVGSIHVSIPSGVCSARGLLFRKSHGTYGDEHTATLTVSVGDGRSTFHLSCRPEIAETVFGLSFDERGVECMGAVLNIKAPDRLYQRYEDDPVDFSLMSIFNLKRNVRKESNVHNLMLHLKNREGMTGASVLNPQGIKKVLQQLFPFYEELLAQDEVYLLATFQSLIVETKKTITSVKVAKFFNEFFANVRNVATFRAKLEEIYAVFAAWESERKSYERYNFEELFIKLPGYAELRKLALRAQSGRALTKMVQDIDAIQFDEAKYPILAELIHDGSIPVSTFFRKEGDETYFLFNDNWELFEEFLSKHREVGIRLAKLASQRTTYEKSFMSYVYFLLYDLPEYLKKYTGKDWNCFPSIVESAHELEPATQPGQTTKRRSALTPIVNNEKCTVTVPYACLKVPGVSTTYTYSLNYSVIRRGLSIDGCVTTSDIEKKLNGRDDYGLMFYTLTGSTAGRGYPTFLIIFERLEDGETQVHFHRTHPLRSKGGDNNPVNNWIRTCYNWMVGNVNLAGIKAQQGDLVFVSIASLPDGEFAVVNSYDSHTFSTPVSFSPCTKKDAQNILGYFDLTGDVLLDHPEHRERIIPAGLYELRQCRSWEANPKGIWTLRID